MNLRSLVTSESTTQNRSGHGIIRKGRVASSRRFIAHPSHRLSASLSHWLSVSRLVLTLAVLLAGGNAAWGDEVELWSNSTGAQQVELSSATITANWPSSIESNSSLRIYTQDNGFQYIATAWNKSSPFFENSWNLQAGNYYNSDESCYDIPFSACVSNVVDLLKNTGFVVQIAGWGTQLITKISVYTPSAVVDPFLNTAKSGVVPGSGSAEKNKTTDAYGDFTLSAANSVTDFTNITNVKYARIYVTDASGKKLDYDTKADGSNNLLEVTGGQAAGNSKKNGLYVYNGGSNLVLSGITVKLNAGVGNLKKYKVVALLSADASANATGNTVNVEPQWDYEYTYTFTYPVEERIVYVPAELNSTSEFTGDYVALKYFTETLDFFGIPANTDSYARAGGMNGNWFARWYVRHKDGTPQTLGSGLEQHATEWRGSMSYANNKFEAQTGNGVHFSGTSVYNGSFSEGNNQQWAIAGMLGYFVVYRPSSVTDFSNYEVVFETTDECDSEDPIIKLRYIFKFTPPIIFEYDGEIANKSAIKQTLDARNSTSVIIDWTDSEKTTDAMTTTGALYGRFFVVDENGDAVDPTSDVHKLTVSGGTLCEKKASGYYIYNNGEGITIPTVTLSSTDAITKYQVKCWFATATTGVAFDDVITTKMTEEPDITNEYTYSSRKPDPTTKMIDREMNWSKVSMRADASTTDPSTDWDTTWDELSLGQYVKWYVVDGTTVLPLELGTERKSGTWVMKADNYTVADNVAVLTGEKPFDSWNAAWGRPHIYAPEGKKYDEVKNCKVICEVCEEASATATPNVRYTFSIIKGFEAENINAVETIEVNTLYDDVNRQVSPVLFGNLDDLNAKLGDNASKLTGENTYARWYITDENDDRLTDLTDWTFTNTAYTAIGEYGWYRTPLGTTVDASLDPTITLPVGYDYKNCRVVCVVTTDKTGINMPTNEPEDMEVKYVFIPYVLDPDNFKFVHYRGVNNEDYVTMGSDVVRSYEPNGETVFMTGSGIRQSVHTVEYDIYVKEDGMALLELPFQDAWTGGNSNEPREYIRWYNWNTDYAVDGLTEGRLAPLNTTPDINSTTPEHALLKDRMVDNGRSRGLMAWFLDREGYANHTVDSEHLFGGGDSYHSEWFITPNKTNVSVTKFFRPDDTSWTQTDVACDVSRYRDGMNTTTYDLEHEPTLSVRYIWHIHPAEEIADKIKNSLTVKDDGLHPLEDGGVISLGLKGGQAMANLHTELQDIDDYYFYGYDESAKTWGATMYRAENLMWRVYTPDMQYYHDFYASDIKFLDKNTNSGYDHDIQTYTNRKVYTEAELADDPVAKQLAIEYPTGMYTRFFKFVVGEYSSEKENVFKRAINPDIYWLSEVEFTPVNGGAKKKYSFVSGEVVPIFAYVTNKDNSAKAPVLRSDIKLEEGSQPVLFGDLKTNNKYKERNQEWLENNMKHVGTITFDPPTGVSKYGFTEVSLPDGNFNTPTNPVDNMYNRTLPTGAGRYGFCYPQLRKQSQVFTYAGITPFHGEYGLFKTKGGQAFDDGTKDQKKVGSGETETYYCWYENGVLNDRTYVETNGAKSGYFLYIDASDESRAITSIPFEADLCAGSSIVVTAAVANMTGYTYFNGGDDKLAASPQVLFKLYGVSTSGQKKLLESFTSGDFNSVGATQRVEWYQVYAKAVLSGDVADSYTNYELEVSNYCDNTDGADYAIDDVRVYTQSTKVLAVVTNNLCDNRDVSKLKITLNADDVLRQLGNPSSTPGKNLFYRIFKRSDDDNHTIRELEAMKGANFYSDGANGDAYGVVSFDYNSSTDYPPELPTGVTSGFYKVGETLYFQLDEREFPLAAAQKYFVSVYSVRAERPGHTESETEQATGWGCPYVGNECTIYSNDFIPKRMFLALKEGDAVTDGHISVSCTTAGGTDEHNYTLVLKVPNVYGGVDDYEGMIHYDFFKGTREEFLAAEEGGVTLHEALESFRTSYSTGDYTASTLPGDAPQVIKTYVTNGKLSLAHSDQFKLDVDIESSIPEKEFYFVAEPIESQLDIGSGFFQDVCNAMEFKFIWDNKANLPMLKIGFDDVEYPEDYTEQVVRVGMEQLDKMMDSGYKLHIPLSDYYDKDKGADSSIEFDDNKLFITETNDPTFPIDGNNKLTEPVVFAYVVNPDGTDGDGTVHVTNDRMFLPLDLKAFKDDNSNPYQFHEGYYYEIAGQYYDATHRSSSSGTRKLCRQDLFFILKVVPKYVTWESQLIAENYYNANWCHDENWLRSKKADIYKSDYKDNGEIDSRLTEHPGFVPMKFTYVTIPGGNHVPDLNNLEQKETTGSAQTGGYLIYANNTMITNTSPTNASHDYSSYSTDAGGNIKYDMMVRYGTDSEGEGCKGHNHRTSGRTTWDRTGSKKPKDAVKVFDVEKYMGNICKEIYFKPGAELIHQERLHYEKAWVEKELVANKWYLAASPLKATYAGDMYVPYSSDAKVNGRQETEAFKDINFDTNLGYSRTKYPIYQRSWGLDSKVYTKTNDVRASSYAAQLGFAGVTSDMAEWSHAYNDVQVPYNIKNGFSIRAHKKDQKYLDKNVSALIRLPKKDTSYDYYQWDNTSPASGKLTQEVSKPNADYAQLLYDFNSSTKATVRQITLSLSDMQSQSDGEYTYYLVGNPLVSAINMGLFFASNPAFEKTYYTYEANTLTTVDATKTPSATQKNIIKPTQAFFLKGKPGVVPESVVFNTDMMTDGNYENGTAYNGNNPSRTRALTLKATNDGGSSTASVNLSEAASDGYAAEEDATTLFDSNLSDVPVVYTVAGNKAVSIDTRPAIDIVPFGVACVASNELVSVKLSWSEERGVNRLYVLDAVTGEMTEVTDGQSLSVQPNDYGRYFLTTRGNLTAIREATAKGIVVSVRNKTVTVRSSEPLTTVRVMTTGGNVVSSLSNCGTEASIPMAIGGVYLVEAQTANNKKTMKVMVK